MVVKEGREKVVRRTSIEHDLIFNTFQINPEGHSEACLATQEDRENLATTQGMRGVVESTPEWINQNTHGLQCIGL